MQGLEGYKLDNDMYQDEVPLDTFFESCPKLTWLYHGISGLAMIPNWPKEGFEDIKKRFYDWRSKNVSKYMKLDEKWMDFVHTHETDQSK